MFPAKKFQSKINFLEILHLQEQFWLTETFHFSHLFPVMQDLLNFLFFSFVRISSIAQN